jgi:hypothetical protein
MIIEKMIIHDTDEHLLFVKHKTYVASFLQHSEGIMISSFAAGLPEVYKVWKKFLHTAYWDVKEGLLAPKACAFYMVPSRHSGEDID